MPKKNSPRATLRKNREPVPLGSSRINQSDLEGLRTAWAHKQLVLFVGAGLSLAYGIPTWKNLVLEMLFDQTEHAQRLKGLLPHYRRALASWLADYFEYNPVILARIIEDNVRKRAARKPGRTAGPDPFHLNIRQHLYAAYKPDSRLTTLGAIADLIAKSEGNIPAVVSFNFDNLLEEELAERRVDHVPVVTGERRLHGRLPIIHPHGFIPRTGDLTDSKIIFTERHYHALTETIFHWALTEIVSHLRHHTVLFVGLSMSDPSLRRLLDACRNSDIPPHWQIQKRHEIRDHERPEAAADIQRRAREWGEVLDRHEKKDPHALLDVIDSALRQADTYDRELFEKMGVKTIWLNDFADIPLLLKSITQNSDRRPQRPSLRKAEAGRRKSPPDRAPRSEMTGFSPEWH